MYSPVHHGKCPLVYGQIWETTQSFVNSPVCGVAVGKSQFAGNNDVVKKDGRGHAPKLETNGRDWQEVNKGGLVLEVGGVGDPPGLPLTLGGNGDSEG